MPVCRPQSLPHSAMTVLASSLVNSSALGKIIIVSLIGGVGVVVVFGILLLGLKQAHAAKTPGAEYASYALSGICGLVCIGAVVIGIYAMAEKPTSKPAKKSAAVLAPQTSDAGSHASLP